MDNKDVGVIINSNNNVLEINITLYNKVKNIALYIKDNTEVETASTTQIITENMSNVATPVAVFTKDKLKSLSDNVISNGKEFIIKNINNIGFIQLVYSLIKFGGRM